MKFVWKYRILVQGLNWNNDIESKNNKSLSLSLFARGNLSSNSDSSNMPSQTCSRNDQEELKEIHFGASFRSKFFSDSKWRVTYSPVKLWHQPRVFSRYEKSLTLLSNSQMPVFKIDALVNKAWNMFSAKAYIHQYVKYGNFEEEELLNAFIFCEQVIKDYKNI